MFVVSQRQAIVGPWRLTCCLGRGRWTSIYAASPASRELDWPADYALKLLDRTQLANTRAVAMLHREAAVTSTVSHARLPGLLDAQLQHGPPYLVLPRVAGVTLAKLLAAPISPEVDFAVPLHRTIWIARQTAEALHALHGARWLHGDVNPANIVISPRGDATLIDLGLARRLDGEEAIHDGWTPVSPRFLAPEMHRAGVRLTSAADIFSLGVVLADMASRHTHCQLQSPPALPPTMVKLLTSMLSREPLRRPTADQVAEQLLSLEISLL